MKIQVKTVEGKSKGSKSFRTFDLISESTVHGFYLATDGNKEFTIWNVKGDWSLIGIQRGGELRFSYTKDFEKI